MEENEIGQRILGCALTVHRALGPGPQLVLPVTYDGLNIDAGYRLDLLVGRRVVIEVKAIEKLVDVHRAQLLSYLKLGGFRLGYLLNFNVGLMKNGIVRIANGL